MQRSYLTFSTCESSKRVQNLAVNPSTSSVAFENPFAKLISSDNKLVYVLQTV